MSNPTQSRVALGLQGRATNDNRFPWTIITFSGLLVTCFWKTFLTENIPPASEQTGGYDYCANPVKTYHVF